MILLAAQKTNVPNVEDMMMLLRRRFVRSCSGRQRRVDHSLVATRTTVDVKRIITRKRAAAVVALEAIISRCCQMLQYAYISDLARIRRARNDVVTFVAANTLTRGVIAVTKDRFEVVFRLRRSVVRS